MDNSELLKNIHRRMMNELASRGKSPQGGAGKINDVIAMDQNLRKAIAEIFLALSEIDDKNLAVNLLAEHVAILVEMINQFKK